MAARLKDDPQTVSVKLVRRQEFAKIVKDVKNPPQPSAGLVALFATKKVAVNKG